MSCQTLHDPAARKSVLYCDTDDRAFGPVFANASAEDFLEWILERGRDPRDMNANTLETWVNTWIAETQEASA